MVCSHILQHIPPQHADPSFDPSHQVDMMVYQMGQEVITNIYDLILYSTLYFCAPHYHIYACLKFINHFVGESTCGSSKSAATIAGYE
jgi:hypothetical protein